MSSVVEDTFCDSGLSEVVFGLYVNKDLVTNSKSQNFAFNSYLQLGWNCLQCSPLRCPSFKF